MKIEDCKDNRNSQNAWAGDGAIEIERGRKSITGYEAQCVSGCVEQSRGLSREVCCDRQGLPISLK